MCFWDVPDKLINLRNRLHHHASQQRLPKPLWPRIRTRIHALPLQQIQKQRKRPFAIRPALHAQIPLICQRRPQRPLDILPPADTAVMHEHQRLVLERMAIVIRQRSLGCRAHMRKNQVRACLARQTLEVLAVPCWKRRCEYAWFWAEFRVCVEAYPEAIAIHGTTVVLFMLVSFFSSLTSVS